MVVVLGGVGEELKLWLGLEVGEQFSVFFFVADIKERIGRFKERKSFLVAYFDGITLEDVLVGTR